MLQAMYPVVLQEAIEKQPLHPLHAAVSLRALKSLIDNYNGPKNEHEFHCLLWINSPSYLKNLFVTVHALNFDVDTPENKNLSEQTPLNMLLCVFVSREFINHYKFSYGQNLFLKPVHCMPLSRVVFKAKNNDSFLWTKSANWSKTLFIAARNKKLLCRLNDVLLVSPKTFSRSDVCHILSLEAIICEPVEQGIFTSNTKLIILNTSDVKIQRVFNFSTLNSEQFFSDVETNNKVEQKICKNKKELKYLKTDNAKGKKIEKNILFQIHIIPQFCSKFQHALKNVDIIADPLNTVFLNCKTMETYGLLTGTFVKVHLVSTHVKNIGEHVKSRSVLICAIDESDEDMVAYISPQLWFNLNHHPSKLIQPDCKLAFIQGDSSSFEPLYAAEVFVSLVQSPCYHAAITCDTILREHLKNRVIYKDDIICISAKEAVEFLQKRPNSENFNNPIVYFRISMIGGTTTDNGYFVHHENTKLYQAGTVQSYIPTTIENFHTSYSDSLLFSSPCPPGLEYYVDILEELIEPILHIEDNIKFQVNCNIILSGSAACGKTVIVRSVCKRLNLHLYQVNCHELLGDNSATIEARLKIILEKASMFSPCVLLLKNIEIIGKEKELKGENLRVFSCSTELVKGVHQAQCEWPIIIIATTNNVKQISTDLLTAFLHVIPINFPNECERSDIIQNLLNSSSLNHDISFGHISQQTAGFGLADLYSLIHEAGKYRYLRLKEFVTQCKSQKFQEDVILAGFPMVQKDLLNAVEKLHHDQAKSSGAPQIPNVKWCDIGGLENVKQEILDTIQLPLDHPEILSTGLRRSGILLYGPPGTGKTLLAKAVATECSLNFISVKGPELINMYVGQSEENVRSVFAQARSAVPCVIFFDELDSIAPNRGRNADSGGVMDRVVSQLLTEIDGLNNSSQVFIIGATNRPDLLDPALLRPGRFDRLVHVGLPQDKNSKLSVLKALTRKLNLSDDVNLDEVVDACPLNMSGADFYSLCSDSMMNAIQESVDLIESGKLNPKDVNVSIHKEHFISSLKKIVVSVTEEELTRYEKMKQKFQY